MKTVPFTIYDTFRLEQFQHRKPQISFGATSSFQFFRFNEVDYFNYLYLKDENYDAAELKNQLSKYLLDGTKRIKIVFASSLHGKFPDLVDQHSKANQLVSVHRQLNFQNIIPEDKGLLQQVKTWDEILLYTRIYLEGFASEKTNYDEVAKNFKLLLDSGNVDFFFVKYHNEVAGLCANYYDYKHFILAAGVTLATYRNLGIHKKTISARLKMGMAKNYSEVYTWTNRDSVSHNNLLKMNFTNHSFYDECLSKPLEDIIREIG